MSILLEHRRSGRIHLVEHQSIGMDKCPWQQPLLQVFLEQPITVISSLFRHIIHAGRQTAIAQSPGPVPISKTRLIPP